MCCMESSLEGSLSCLMKPVTEPTELSAQTLALFLKIVSSRVRLGLKWGFLPVPL
jgi:hypothetical protein